MVRIATHRVGRAEVSAGLLVGLVRGFTIAVSLFALASIVFGGELSPYVLQGAGMFFVGTAVLSLFLALCGKFPSPIASSPMPVAVVMIFLAETLPLKGVALHATYVVIIIGCALSAGILFYVIGRFRLANLFRFVPFSVSAGALAGSGVLILLLALRLSGLSADPSSWSGLMQPESLAKWVPGLGFGALLFVLTRIWRKYWLMPLVFAGFCLLFHAALQILDYSMDDAVAVGLFMDVEVDATLWPVIQLQDIALVDWSVVASQGLNALVVFLVLVILTVVSFSQLELGAGMEFEWNREFRMHGIANLLSGCAGGIPGATLASTSLPNIALQANTPVTSIVIGVVLLLCMFFGDGVLRLVPIPATSGFLIFVAVPLISDWLVKSRARLDLPEYLMLVAICAVIVLVGFLEAIALGLLLSLVFFAVRLSQVHPIEAKYSLAERRSRRVRNVPEQVILNMLGRRARIHHLRGYLFFGSAFILANQLREFLREEDRPIASIIDFGAVTGFDLSALDSLKAFVQRARAHGVSIAFSTASERLKQEVRRDFGPALVTNITWAANEEDALAWAEDLLIEHQRGRAIEDAAVQDELREAATPALLHRLDRLAGFEALASELHEHTHVLKFDDGQPIVVRAEPQKGAQLVLRGRAWLKDAEGRRLRELEAGDLIEAASAAEPMEAALSCIAEGPCHTLLVTPNDLRKLEREHAELAFRLCRYLLSANDSSQMG